ncbi:hypothetical protein EKK58_10110 [Candidatus Dependentiae bacterium]|nr:MAG: hypothetical protein EKK58_10110 [Candidatus Dependentiae bacterium]
MKNISKKLPSGAELYITMASFEVGHRLLKAVMKEAETININFGANAKSFKDFAELDVNDTTINTLKNIVARLISSDLIENVAWECMAYATYNKVKIVKENNVFDEPSARGDYLIVVKEVMIFNLLPFSQSLGSLFTDMLGSNTESLK